MKHVLLMSVLMVAPLVPSMSFGESSPHYKVQLDPFMAAAGYVNLQVDREVSPVLSVGLMGWYLDKDSWGNSTEQSDTSVGVRIDWFERGVFERGWHSNAMVKLDFEGADYARSRLKLTQSYQFVGAGVFIKLGIGAQFVAESSNADSGLYRNYQSWMLPAWEVSVGRAF